MSNETIKTSLDFGYGKQWLPTIRFCVNLIKGPALLHENEVLLTYIKKRQANVPIKLTKIDCFDLENITILITVVVY